MKKYPIVSEQIDAHELVVLLKELEQRLVAGATGSVVEFGCYVGTASVFIGRLLAHYSNVTSYHVYDSFEGLPEKTAKDLSPAGEQFKAGELLATKKQFIATMKKAGLALPAIHKGWFSDLAPHDVPGNIMFAFLDGDYYESIKDSLRLIEGKLAEGAVIVVDDYANEALPGAAKAVDEWLTGKPYALRTQASLAIITPVL